MSEGLSEKASYPEKQKLFDRGKKLHALLQDSSHVVQVKGGPLPCAGAGGLLI